MTASKEKLNKVVLLSKKSNLDRHKSRGEKLTSKSKWISSLCEITRTQMCIPSCKLCEKRRGSAHQTSYFHPWVRLCTQSVTMNEAVVHSPRPAAKTELILNYFFSKVGGKKILVCFKNTFTFFWALHLLIPQRSGSRNAENTVGNTNFIPKKCILDCIKGLVLSGLSAQNLQALKVSKSVDKSLCLWEVLSVFLARINSWAFSITIHLEIWISQFLLQPY